MPMNSTQIGLHGTLGTKLSNFQTAIDNFLAKKAAADVANQQLRDAEAQLTVAKEEKETAQANLDAAFTLPAGYPLPA